MHRIILSFIILFLIELGFFALCSCKGPSLQIVSQHRAKEYVRAGKGCVGKREPLQRDRYRSNLHNSIVVRLSYKSAGYTTVLVSLKENRLSLVDSTAAHFPVAKKSRFRVRTMRPCLTCFDRPIQRFLLAAPRLSFSPISRTAAGSRTCRHKHCGKERERQRVVLVGA